MKSRRDVERFKELYKSVRQLEPHQLLQDELRIIRSDPHLEYFGRLVCQRLFDHQDFDAIPLDGIEEFVEKVDLFVVKCLEGKQLKQ